MVVRSLWHRSGYILLADLVNLCSNTNCVGVFRHDIPCNIVNIAYSGRFTSTITLSFVQQAVDMSTVQTHKVSYLLFTRLIKLGLGCSIGLAVRGCWKGTHGSNQPRRLKWSSHFSIFCIIIQRYKKSNKKQRSVNDFIKGQCTVLVFSYRVLQKNV